MAIITIKDLAGKIDAIPASINVKPKDKKDAEKKELARRRVESIKILEGELLELKVREPNEKSKILAKEKEIADLKK